MGGFIDFAAHKLPLRPGATRQERIDRSYGMLLRALNLKTTVAFIGSGCSVPFGYPLWDAFAEKVLAQTVVVLSGLERTPPELEELSRLRGKVENERRKNRKIEPNTLMYLIGACKKSLRENGKQDEYGKMVAREFARAPNDKPRRNPYEILVEFPIRRFVTTNYDCEIERAVINKFGLPAKDYGLSDKGESLGAEEARESRLSFTQKPASLDCLTLFALAGAAGSQRMVFHCHGRFDDPESVVATESDYQELYLGRNDGAVWAYQKNIQLLLESNPLLFLGYSLRDEDLLRPLRQLGVLDPGRKDSRPIFALLEDSAEAAEDAKDAELSQYSYESYFERFGLHILTYRVKPVQDHTEAFCDKLQEIKEQWQNARAEWLRKPLLKKPAVIAKKPAPHCEVQAAEVPASPLAGLRKEIARRGLVVLTGPSGAGKSLHLLQLMKDLEEPAERKALRLKGAFYWNAHYTNEAVTAIDTVLAYLDPHHKLDGNRYERCRQGLRKHRFLLVFDACERLLRQSQEEEKAGSYSLAFKRLLRIVADPAIKSTVVLATRRWPADLDSIRAELGDRCTLRKLSLGRVEASELAGFDAFSGLPEKGRSALCSLLRGHNYGLHLAGRYLHLRREDGSSLEKHLEELNHQLASRRPDERLREMLRLLLKTLDHEKDHGLASAYLERLALFLGPISPEAHAVCLENARNAVPAQVRERPSLLRELCDCSLLVPMVVSRTREEAYTVHATVRGPLFQSRQGSTGDPLPSFGISGFLSGRNGVAPDRSRREQVKNLFAGLLARAREASTTGRRSDASRLCRDAFTLLRTQMEANTILRWSTFKEYVELGIRLAILAKEVSSDSWDYCEFPDAARFICDEEAPLYAAELAWLYNDIALALSSEGYVIDAYSIWEQAYEICRQIEDPSTGGGFQLEVLLSLAFNLIEMGRIPAARRYLEDAERLLRGVSDDDYAARILGLRGWMAHLSGNVQAAKELYDRCLGLLQASNNLRAKSVFFKHKADLLIETGALSEADLLIRDSRALAESGLFPELVCNARMAEGRRQSQLKDLIKARAEFKWVLREAQNMGFRKLEVRALTALARISLRAGDADGAQDLAMRSLTLANELGLGLRRTHSLVVLGLATLEMDQRSLGISYLRLARGMANEQEYWSRGREAENKLLELGESPERMI